MIDDVTLPARHDRVSHWERAALVGLALTVVLLRLHTLREPIDCDEAAYAYVAHRLLKGDRLYVDVFENKPPLAYAPYAVAVALGGYTERAIRLLPIPFTLLTLWAVWRAARLLGPTPIGILAASVYAILQADPHVFGNGANLEVYMNALLALALWLGLRLWLHRPVNPPLLFAVGLCLGAAAGIKQVAGLYVGYAMVMLVLIPAWRRRSVGVVFRGLALLLAGVLLPWGVMAGYCVWNGGLESFWQAVFVYAREVAREASASLYEQYAPYYSLGTSLSASGSMPVGNPGPSALLASAIQVNDRLLVLTQWLLLGNPMANAWWGAVMWPALVLSLRQAIRAAILPRHLPGSAFVAGWFLVTVAAIAWPGLFWQHYYMLLVPVVAVLSGRLVGELWLVPDPWRRLRRATIDRWFSALLLLAASGLLAWSYVPYTPEEITTRYKGGAQWVALRDLGHKLRNAFDRNTKLFVWGWQSPLHLYTGFDSVTPYFFTDPLMQAYINRSHPLVDRRKRRIVQDLSRHQPMLVFAGEQPFAELYDFLRQSYLPVNRLPLDGRGLYVRIDTAIQRFLPYTPYRYELMPLSPWIEP